MLDSSQQIFPAVSVPVLSLLDSEFPKQSVNCVTISNYILGYYFDVLCSDVKCLACSSLVARIYMRTEHLQHILF